MNNVLLHSCCAPCSAAILNHLQEGGYDTTIFFCNPNIHPLEEYLIRKKEITRYAKEIGVEVIDADKIYENWQKAHSEWVMGIKTLSEEPLESLSKMPERGERCLACFKYRLAITAKYAATHGFDCFTTTLASSRWKDLTQINEAGIYAEALVDKKAKFWDKNWRKGGLYEIRNQLAKQFYNQTYCGCEFSHLM